jgi:hypothetical protein
MYKKEYFNNFKEVFDFLSSHGGIKGPFSAYDGNFPYTEDAQASVICKDGSLFCIVVYNDPPYSDLTPGEGIIVKYIGYTLI